MIDDAKAIIARINPTNGNLNDLQSFYENYQALAQLYDPQGPIDILIEGMDAMKNIHFGQDDDDGDNQIVQFYPMPAPVPITTAIAQESSDDDGDDDGDGTEGWIEEEDLAVLFRKVKWQKSFEFSSSEFTESLTTFSNRMMGWYEDVLVGCPDCSHRPGEDISEADGWDLNPPEVYYAVAYLSDSWKNYYKRIRDELYQSIEEDEYKQALLRWAQYAWYNCHLTTYNRPGRGLNWEWMITEPESAEFYLDGGGSINAWGFGLFDKNGN